MGLKPEEWVAECGCAYLFGERVRTCEEHGEPTASQDDYEEVPDNG